MRQKNNNPLVLFLSVLLAFLLTGCSQATPIPTNIQEPVSKTEITETQPTVLTKTEPSPALDTESLKNLEYRLGIVKEAQADSDGVIKLADGIFEQAIQNSSAKLQVNYVDSAMGDLNGDGVEDAVVLLAINTGGTGTFMQLAAILNQDGELKHLDTADLGDRTKINSIQIEGGTINVQAIVHSDTDPLCCPSLEKLQEFILQGDHLVNQER